MSVGFLGARNTRNYEVGGAYHERPRSFREGIAWLQPNGDGVAPLVAMTSKLPSDRLRDPVHHWFEQELCQQGGSVVGVFTDAAKTTAYATAGAAGDVVYVQVPEDVASQIRPRHKVLLRVEADPGADILGKVEDVLKNGASSHVTVQLKEADGKSANFDLTSCDGIQVVGNVNAERGVAPPALSYDPVERTNYAGIFRTPHALSRTAMQTNYRTMDALQRSRQHSLLYHGVEMERDFFYSIPINGTDSVTGQPERYTGGLRWFISTYAPENSDDYRYNTDFSAKSWIAGGREWLDDKLRQIFLYGSKRKTAFVGNTALGAIQQLAADAGYLQLNVVPTRFGWNVREWVTPFGTLELMQHALMSIDLVDTRSMYIIEPNSIRFKFMLDTTFKPDENLFKGGEGIMSIDGISEEYITEGLLEFQHAKRFGYLRGFGANNLV
jgi:hypothetical protein